MCVCGQRPAEYQTLEGQELCAICADEKQDRDGLSVLVEGRGPWSVTDLGSAEWAMHRIAELDYQAEEIRAQAKAWRARYDQWEERELKPVESSKAYFAGHLIDYARQRMEAEPKLRHIDLPSGRIQARTVGPRAKVADESAVIAFVKDWAAEMGEPIEDLLRLRVDVPAATLKRIVDQRALKDLSVAVTPNGDYVPGVEVIEGQTTFTFTVLPDLVVQK